MKKKIFFIFFIVILTMNCAKKIATVTIVDDKSALEKQILGQFQDFNKDVYLLASVRAIDNDGRLIKREPLPEDKRRVVAAIQRMAFNADDIKTFKTLNVVGENNKAELEIMNQNISKLSVKQQTLLKELIKQENDDRLILMNRILQTNINLKDNEMNVVRQIYAAMRRDTADKGELVQLPDGEWQIK